MEEADSIVPKEVHEGTNCELKNTDSVCRICLDSGAVPMINPCHCIGTAKFTHEKCLKTWIIIKYQNISLAHCEICNFNYNLKIHKSWKCNSKQGINEKFAYCCSIPILISVLLALGIVLFIVGVYHLDFQNDVKYSIVILLACTLPTFATLVLLFRSMYKACIDYEVKEFSIAGIEN